MGRISPLVYAVILVVMTTHIQRVSGQIGWFVHSPRDVALLEGDSVVLKCQLNIGMIVEHGEYKVTWSKNDKKLNFTDPDHSNYWLTGDVHSAQYYLLISEADRNDAGNFSCAVYENIGTHSAEDLWVMHAVTTAEVRVIVRPPPPECRKTDLDIQSNQTELNYEGDLIELSCAGYLSHPSFMLEMRFKDMVITEEDGAWVHIDEDQVQEQAYRFVADYRDNGASFTCTLTSTEFPQYNESCEMVALNILHEPKLDFVSDRNEVYQGESVTVSCLTVSNPARVIFNWHTDPVQNVVFREGGRVLEVPSVSSDTGFLNITCVVTNDHGVTRASRLISVLTNSTDPLPTEPEEVPQTVAPITPEDSTQAPPIDPPTSTVATQAVTKPSDKISTTSSKPSTKVTEPSKDNLGLNSDATISTPVIAAIVVVTLIIIAVLVLIFVFMYKTVKLSTKRRDDEIRVVYRDGTSTVIDRRTHGVRGNLNVTVEPAVNEGAVISTNDMEPGAYSMPPPYTKGDLPSVLDISRNSMDACGQDATPYNDSKDDMYVDMQGQF